MDAIVPRWEWRTFGSRLAAAESFFDTLTAEATQDSDEVYLLGRAGDAIVKIRAGLADVKLLRAVDGAGLEQWEPVLKVGFPLPVGDVAAIVETLGASVAEAGVEAWSVDRLLAAAADLGVRAAPVHKHRRRYTVDGCMTELTDVTVDGRPTRTVAVESPDPAAVTAVVSRIGLGAYLNRNYGRGLAALLDGEPERFAVIDVGTNSVKFHIAERAEGGTWRTVVDRAEVTRLGEGIEQTGGFSDEAVARTVEAIAGMVIEAHGRDVRAIAAVGTAGLRMASNSHETVLAVKARTGVTVEVIPGEEESRLAYLATAAALGPQPGAVVVFDTGGGSSQFTFGTGDAVDERFSVNVGAVRYTERFGLDRATSAEVLAEAGAAIAGDLVRLDGRPPPDGLVGMGGAITNLTAVALGLAVYDPERVQGARLDRAEIDRQIELYRTLDAEARRGIVGLQPARAEVILTGALIVRTVVDKLGVGELTVSDRGLRHGLLAERFAT